MKKYLLMNRDEPVLVFTSTRSRYNEPVYAEDEWLVDYRPIGYGGIQSFLERRKAPDNRANMPSMMTHYGIDSLESFIRVSHALSLTDTFWVKEEDSPLAWRDVSLYGSPFSDSIRDAAFDGTSPEPESPVLSPEFTTDGTYPKCWVRREDGIFLVKAGSPYCEIEPLSEYLSWQFAAKFCQRAVPYDMERYHGKLVSTCPLFTNESVGLAPAGAVFSGSRPNLEEMDRYFEGIGSEDAFHRMYILDAILLNPDRHFGNFGVLFDTSTMEVLSMAPVYDNNKALFPELDSDQLKRPEWYIRRCSSRLRGDFILTSKAMLTDPILEDLRKLRDFEFQQHPVIRAEQERLDALSAIVRERIQLILPD